MSDIALRPRSPTELVDAAFQLYRRDPLPFITGLASVYVPWLLIIAASGLFILYWERRQKLREAREALAAPVE